jgi:hypothetical protein
VHREAGQQNLVLVGAERWAKTRHVRLGNGHIECFVNSGCAEAGRPRAILDYKREEQLVAIFVRPHGH